MGKKEKEKIQVEDVSEAEIVKTEKSPKSKGKEENQLVDTKMELED